MFRYVKYLRCPICQSDMDFNGHSLICVKQHCFDRAKQGYVNLFTGPKNTTYDLELFHARRRIFQAGFFQPLTTKLLTIMDTLPRLQSIIDVGCGEGSQLAELIKHLNQNQSEPLGVGIDLAKDGIKLAAKNHPDLGFFVADLTQSPFKTASFSLLFNILSPANYREFKRIVVPRGHVIKVIPGEQYLQEIRSIVQTKTSKTATTDLIQPFRSELSNTEIHSITYHFPLTSETVEDLLKMTPLTWHAGASERDQIKNLQQVTVEYLILVGQNPE